jgi:ethanolamine utilization protein EutN
MILAKVISRVVATEKLASIPARPLLSVRPLEGFGDPTPLIAIDSVQAGPGDTVLILQEGSGARQAVLDDPSQPLPAQAVVVGIVDSVYTDG